MPEILQRRSTPPILALSAVAVLVVVFVLLNGGGSQGASNAGLAEYMPADSVAYAETDLRPDGTIEAEVDAAVRTLTGSSLSASLNRAFGSAKKTGFDYREEVEPWLAGPVAVSAGDAPHRLRDWSPRPTTLRRRVPSPRICRGVKASRRVLAPGWSVTLWSWQVHRASSTVFPAHGRVSPSRLPTTLSSPGRWTTCRTAASPTSFSPTKGC